MIVGICFSNSCCNSRCNGYYNNNNNNRDNFYDAVTRIPIQGRRCKNKACSRCKGRYKVEFDIVEVDKIELDFVDFHNVAVLSLFCRKSTVAGSFDFVDQLSNDNL